MPAVETSFTDEDREDFVLCARYGELEELKAYLDNGMNISAKDPHGNTALHMAAGNGHTEIVEVLLGRAGPEEVNGLNESKNTALHWAALNGHLPVVKLLIAAGADPDIKNEAGHSATYEALSREKEDVATFLLDLEQERAKAGRGGPAASAPAQTPADDKDEDDEDEEIKVSVGQV